MRSSRGAGERGDVLLDLYVSGAIEPPASHVFVGVVGAIYAALVVYYLAMWLGGRTRARAARHARTGVLREGAAQIFARIAGRELLLRGPGDQADGVDAEMPAFTLEAGGGPVHIEEGTMAVYHPHGDGNAPLRGGDYVEVAGELVRDTKPTADGYRGDVRDRWTLKPHGTESPLLTIWRHARTHPHERRADMAVGGLAATLVFLLVSAAMLGGYLTRLTVGETDEARVTAIRDAGDQLEVSFVRDADHLDASEGETERVDADRAGDLEVVDHLPYRNVGGHRFLSTLGAGVGLGLGSLIGASIFLLLAVAGWISIVAAGRDG